MKAEQTKANEHSKVAGLSEAKIKQKVMGNVDSFKLGKKLWRNKGIVKRRQLKKNHLNVSGIVRSTVTDLIHYNCSAKCDYEGKITEEFACPCLFQQSNRNYLCKHLVCLLLDRCNFVSRGNN